MSDGFQFGLGALIASVVFCSIIAAIAAGIAGAIQGVPVNLNLTAGGPFDAYIKNGFSAGAVVGLLAYLTATAYAGFAESTRPKFLDKNIYTCYDIYPSWCAQARGASRWNTRTKGRACQCDSFKISAMKHNRCSRGSIKRANIIVSDNVLIVFF
jgi:hypothetical protein